jgi:hypothetical protein
VRESPRALRRGGAGEAAFPACCGARTRRRLGTERCGSAGAVDTAHSRTKPRIPLSAP